MCLNLNHFAVWLTAEKVGLLDNFAGTVSTPGLSHITL